MLQGTNAASNNALAFLGTWSSSIPIMYLLVMGLLDSTLMSQLVVSVVNPFIPDPETSTPAENRAH